MSSMYIANIVVSIIMLTILSILTIQEVIRLAKDFIKRKRSGQNEKML